MTGKLTAKVVPYSGVVGSSVQLLDGAGACVALLIISVPSPSRDYRSTALPIAEKVAGWFNAEAEGEAGTEAFLARLNASGVRKGGKY